MKTTTKQDFSFRIEHTGKMAVTSGVEYLCNIANRLFFMIPGTDDYNKDMGLDITTRAKRPYIDDERDTEYESRIYQQFRDYTDMHPMAIVAIYKSPILRVSMNFSYGDNMYVLLTSSDPSVLATQILPKEIIKP